MRKGDRPVFPHCSCGLLTRRAAFAGALACAATPAWARTDEPEIFIGAGCGLSNADQRARLAGQIEPIGQGPRGTLYGSSGDPALDNMLGSYLADMASFFQVRPGFGFYDDRAALNAFAMPTSALANSRGTVAFGKGLLAKALSSPARELFVLAICAHEFGHVVQYFTPYMELLEKGWPNQRRVELHADYLSGAYIGRRRDRFASTQVESLKACWEGMGDTLFTSLGHHGTSEERLRAVQAGFDFMRGRPDANVEAVANAGAMYLGAAKWKP